MATETTFFSYSRTDSAFVLKLAKDLRDAGARLWLDQLDIKAGSHWDSSVEEALNSASRLIVILSSESVKSNNVMDEVSFALESGKTVIPVLLSDCVTPFRLRRVQRIDFTGDYQRGLNYLLETLGHSPLSNLQTSSANPEKEQVQTIVPETTPVPERNQKEEADNKLWDEARQTNSIASYTKYINEPVTGLHNEKARQLINELETIQKEKDNEKKNQEILAEKERALNEARENKLWEEATGANTVSSYKKYLNETGTGLFKEKAQQEINRLEAEQKEKEFENKLWQTAKTENKISLYKEYLQNYPNGMYRTNASAAIKEIEEAERRQQKMVVEKENVPAPEIEKTGSSKKYYLIGGSAVLLGLVIWGITKFNAPVLPEEKINEHTDSTSLVSQTTGGAANPVQAPKTDSTGPKVDQPPAPPVNDKTEASTQAKTNTTDKAAENNNASPLKMGGQYQGGIIFYIDNTGKHGLIAAEKDFDGTYTWYKAVQKCNELGPGWHLPKKNELALLYTNKDAVGSFADGSYWSSSESGSGFAWGHGFDSDFGDDYSKDGTFYVRAVKTF